MCSSDLLIVGGISVSGGGSGNRRLESGVDFLGFEGRAAFAVAGSIWILNFEAGIAQACLIIDNAALEIALTVRVDIDRGALLLQNSVVGIW